MPADAHPQLLGIDFTSRPSRRKPVVMAVGHAAGGVLRLEGLETFDTLEACGRRLAEPGHWVGGFDFPFGLPRELVAQLGWPTDWLALMRHYASLPRERIRDTFAAFCAARPPGAKFAHRACDRPAGSSPSMKWVNPPVAYMLHAGVPLLLDAGVHMPGLHDGDRQRVALEAYPGLPARQLIGRRPYKSDERARQTPERLIARKDVVDALEQGRTRWGPRLKLGHAQREALVDDASGDRLDAVLCLLMAAWAAQRPGWGRPPDSDRLEGWIVGAD